jgi:DNA-binding NarL/FixJ family response regulator
VIRVLVVDDEALVRSGLRMILEAAPDLTVVGEAADGAAAVSAAQAHRPDVVLMDIRMPHVDGLAAARSLATLPEPPRVVVLTTFDTDEYVYAALAAGAAGFLLKDTPPLDLVQAVRVVAAGDAMLSPSVTRRLIERFAARGASRAVEARRRVAGLTAREQELLVLVGQGLSNAQIARQKHLSEATVKAHVSSMLTKLDAASRVQVAILANDAGLLDG